MGGRVRLSEKEAIQRGYIKGASPEPVKPSYDPALYRGMLWAQRQYRPVVDSRRPILVWALIAIGGWLLGFMAALAFVGR